MKLKDKYENFVKLFGNKESFSLTINLDFNIEFSSILKLAGNDPNSHVGFIKIGIIYANEVYDILYYKIDLVKGETGIAFRTLYFDKSLNEYSQIIDEIQDEPFHPESGYSKRKFEEYLDKIKDLKNETRTSIFKQIKEEKKEFNDLIETENQFKKIMEFTTNDTSNKLINELNEFLTNKQYFSQITILKGDKLDCFQAEIVEKIITYYPSSNCNEFGDLVFQASWNLPECLYFLGKINFKLNRYSISLNYLNLAKKEFSIVGDNSIVFKIYKLIGVIYYLNNNQKLLFEHESKYQIYLENAIMDGYETEGGSISRDELDY